ncbi:hypothetical protein PR202_ga06023 [Eleusine coracana subsp. coracana]|uniref:protein-serine/threonine phosphatase n=1 Tax=Eleusine coracana subsp. coracana TaxID=191504 RepID=A0AAV5BWF0_ELECO|nr:hypothetical protein PR202_ga06023 [Eleusine coracana subsp. coracana]
MRQAQDIFFLLPAIARARGAVAHPTISARSDGARRVSFLSPPFRPRLPLPALFIKAASRLPRRPLPPPTIAVAVKVAAHEMRDSNASDVCEVVAAGHKVATVAAAARRRRRLELSRLRRTTADEKGGAKRIRSSPSCSDSSSEDTGPGWPAASALSHGAVSVIGRRREMEDAVAVELTFLASSSPSDREDFFAVYDGHGGARVAQACSERLHVLLAEEVSRQRSRHDGVRWKDAMVASFARVDGEVTGGLAPPPAADDSPFRTVGSTAVVGHRRIVVANCGDSRAVLSRGGVAVPLSTDHKVRYYQIDQTSGKGWKQPVAESSTGTGIESWEFSQHRGDYYLKPFVSAEPEVTVMERTDQDEFLILASDGLWDVVSNEVACKIARNCLNGRAASMFPETVSGRTAADAAALLTELAISRGSKDNISVVVVELRRLKGGS